MMKERGARLHPRSGAGPIKDDGSDDHNLYEVKDARRSFTLKAADLKGLMLRAIRQGRNGVMLIYFSDSDMTVECRLIPGGKELIK